MLLTSVASYLVPLLSWLSNYDPQPSSHIEESSEAVQFELRHLHAVSPTDARVVFSDVRNGPPKESLMDSSYSVWSRKGTTYRPSSFAAHTHARLRSMRFGENEWLDWEEEEILGPDVERRETLLELAKMTNNAYLEPDDPDWYDLDGHWNVVRHLSCLLLCPKFNGSQTYPFGWEPDTDGFRGHVFANPDNSTVVVSIKGTSAGIFGGGGPTVKKDKINDNLLFSCCCARIDWTWTTVCDCYRGGWKCDQNCVEQALIEDSLFYPIGTVSQLSYRFTRTTYESFQNLYNNITYL